jgi:hypothetical protein
MRSVSGGATSPTWEVYGQLLGERVDERPYGIPSWFPDADSQGAPTPPVVHLLLTEWPA